MKIYTLDPDGDVLAGSKRLRLADDQTIDANKRYGALINDEDGPRCYEYDAINNRRRDDEEAKVIAEAPAIAMVELRSQRDHRLQESDYTQLADYQEDGDTKLSWAAYRQKLRDLPATTTNPETPPWPRRPTGT